MGIPSYFSYIIKNYSNIILNEKRLLKNNICFSNLLMDCNSIIYDEFRKLEKNAPKVGTIDIKHFEGELINNVIGSIGNYIKNISPSDIVYIAFDGVAPFAKMKQQRTRRYKSIMTGKIDNIIGPELQSFWTTSRITPGTEFMNMLSLKVKRSFNGLESHFNVKKIIVSGSDEFGEGEHKMFKYIRESRNSVKGNTIVYGLDSDLIMLSLFHCNPFEQFFIYRETPEFGKSIINDENTNSKYLFLDIHALAKAILCELDCENDYHRLYDYIFICFLLGNDFLPHFPSLNLRKDGLDILLDIYKKNFGNNVNRGIINKNLSIQWRSVGLLFSELAKNEQNRFVNEYNLREKMSKRKWNLSDKENKEFTIQNVPVIYRSQELYISPQEQFWEQRYYKALFSHNNDSVKDITVNYLQGLEWVFKYYTDDCPDWKWSYKYNYPPLLKDICKYFPKKQVEYFEKNMFNPFSSNVQLAYVLPLKYRHLLPYNMANYLENNDNEFFVESPKYEWAFCRYFWESHPVLPEIPIKNLEKWDTLCK